MKKEEMEKFMSLALVLAEEGIGRVSPNPLVGAVIVKDGRVIGKGAHLNYGGLHAERAALQACSEDPKGAVLFVNLEPCCHYGKQPPCTEAIIEAGISTVVVGSPDPNPKVAGRGIDLLRKAGIEVITGCLTEQSDLLNRIFLHYIQKKMPYLVMKYAMTRDGKIASRTGDSRGISGPEANRFVHGLRHRYRGIMVGIGTVLADDPLLTCRIEGGRDPVRIICDSRLRIPLNSRLVRTADRVETIVATLDRDAEKTAALEKAGIRLIYPKEKDGRIDPVDLLLLLAEEKIDSILLEGGAELSASFLKEGLVQKVYTLIAPKILGGREALSPVGGRGLDRIDEAPAVKNLSLQILGEDILIESEF